jgi:hypothetical protein
MTGYRAGHARLTYAAALRTIVRVRPLSRLGFVARHTERRFLCGKRPKARSGA